MIPIGVLLGFATSTAALYFFLNEFHPESIDRYKGKGVIDFKDNPEGYDNRADCYIAMEDYTNALKDYDKAIDLDSEDPRYLLLRAAFYSSREQYDLALMDVNDAIQIDPNSIYAYNINFR